MHEGIPTNAQEENMTPDTLEERVLSPEEKSEVFRSAIEHSINAALQTVAERFERSPERRNNLEFHNTRHTADVIRRYEAIMEAVRAAEPSLVDTHAEEVGRLAAAHHDTVQEWEAVEMPSKLPGEEGLAAIMRKRFVGANEAASTAGALLLMEQVNTEAGTEIFTPEDKEIVRGGHDVTVPGFNPEKGTVVQPNLIEQSSIITRAIALADLGTAGMDGKEAYTKEGDALFREENLDIADALQHPETLSSAQKAFFTRRMLGWSQFQEKFAAGRRAMLEEEIRPLPITVQEKLRTLFTKFDESIEGARTQAERRATLSFEELAQDMGYTLGNSEKVVY